MPLLPIPALPLMPLLDGGGVAGNCCEKGLRGARRIGLLAGKALDDKAGAPDARLCWGMPVNSGCTTRGAGIAAPARCGVPQ